MSRRRSGVALAVVGTAVACLTACAGQSAHMSGPNNPAGVEISGVHQDTTYYGAEPPEPYRMPDITLTADNGAPFNLVTDTAYPVTLVFFGYTNCPDVCPLVMSDLASTYLQLPSAVRAETQVLFITTDPARDTDSVLRSYLSRYNSSFLGLRGSLGTIKKAAQALGVAITGVKRLPSGGYDVGHSSQVIGFHDNTAPVVWTAGTPVPDVVADVVKLAGR
jgi:protein SCO1/2